MIEQTKEPTVSNPVKTVVSSDLIGHSRPYLNKLTKEELVAITEGSGKYKDCTIERASHILTGFKSC